MSIWEWICSTLCSRCDLETMGKICTLQNGAPCLAYEDDIISAPITQLQQENGLEMLTTMNAERDPFILKLPSEKIASHVFLLSMGERDIQDVCKSGVRLPTPFLLGAVCSGWRALARSTPELWSKLAYTSHNITSLKNQRNTPQLIADWLVRSGSLPLTLRMSKGLEAYNGYFHPSDYDDGWKLIIDILNLHSECWCDVDFELPTNYIAALRGTSPPKNLRKLSFSSLNVYSQWEMTWVGSSPIERYRVNWCPINPIDSARFCPKNENGSKISRAKLSGFLSPRVQWCQVWYFRTYSIWLYQARFYGHWLVTFMRILDFLVL